MIRPSETSRIPLWQRDFWSRIVEAALAGEPDSVVLDYHPNFQRPALSRYGASTPKLLGWFKAWNAGKPYRQQVKPFNFLTAFQMDTFLRPVADRQAEGPRKRGRPKKSTVAPIAPFDPDPETAPLKAFDRHTGEPVSASNIKTYQTALRGYHLSRESKFGNGDFLNRGTTQRRHIVASGVRLIGKEANRVDLDMPDEGPADYGSSESGGGSSKKSRG